MSEPNPFQAPETNPVHDGFGRSHRDNLPLYRMGTQKLLLMSLLSLGLYDLAWFWRQWRAARDGGEDISVFWRTFFAPLFYFDLKKRLDGHLLAADIVAAPAYGLAPAVYLITAVLARASGRLPAMPPVFDIGLSIALAVAAALALTWSQTAINRTFEKLQPEAPSNDGLTGGSIAVGVLGTGAWVALILLTFGAL